MLALEATTLLAMTSAQAAGPAPLPLRLPFLDDRAKVRAVTAVKSFEAQTSAELVITVKKQADTYPQGPMLLGVLFASAALCVLLFYPRDFSVAMMPLDVTIAFAVGYGLARLLPPVGRALVPATRQRSAVDVAAKAAFVDLGVTRTSGRTGLIVYVALYERMVSVVCDVGVTQEAKAAAVGARPALEDAVRRLDVGAFAATLEALGPMFATTMARAEDDVNELSDDIA